MARNGHGKGKGDEHPHGMPFPVADILGRLFGMSPEDMRPVDQEKEKKAYEAAKETALKVAATMVPPKSQSGGIFIRIFQEKFIDPIGANPLVPSGATKKLALALEEKTGVMRERGTDKPRPEVWGDVLHDHWFDHVAEHIAKELWMRLPGEPKEKERQLEEILPVLQKYGRAVFDTHAIFAREGTDDQPSPLWQAAECAGDSLKDLVIAKARELGILPMV